MEFPSFINWTRPFPFSGLLGSIFYFYSNFNITFCKQTVEIQIRRRILRRLIWFCTVCQCRIKMTLCQIVSLLLSHWYPGSDVGLIVLIPDLCPLSYFKWVNTHFFYYQEGAISVWYPSMQYERYYVISDDNEDTSGQKRRFKMWVTDAIYMPNCQKIAISSTSRDIRFFDTSTSQYFEEYHLFGKYSVWVLQNK